MLHLKKLAVATGVARWEHTVAAPASGSYLTFDRLRLSKLARVPWLALVTARTTRIACRVRSIFRQMSAHLSHRCRRAAAARHTLVRHACAMQGQLEAAMGSANKHRTLTGTAVAKESLRPHGWRCFVRGCHALPWCQRLGESTLRSLAGVGKLLVAIRCLKSRHQG